MSITLYIPESVARSLRVPEAESRIAAQAGTRRQFGLHFSRAQLQQPVPVAAREGFLQSPREIHGQSKRVVRWAE